MIKFLDFLKEQDQKYSYLMAEFYEQDNQDILKFNFENIKQKDIHIEEKRELYPHVTIVDGLHDNYPDKIQKFIQNISPFYIELGEVTKFISEKYDVLKIDVISDDLKHLNKDLKNNFKYTTNFENYVPHITLAYCNKNSCDHLLKNKYFKNKKIKIKNFVFSNKIKQKTYL